ncbi:aldose epimerase [Kribbella capetownensis]|uniref:Aldose epimerase n=2 Tax=Kribbella capetownensis TaxID=1572659 RepID=A0A4R0K3M0_9ACTN|nr:aldose epimerase [Kribbella capetownensis]
MHSTTVLPSGEQYEITSGSQRATIVEVGGGLREYEVDGRPVIDPYPAEQICDGAHGAPLAPWPNRLADGRYTFDGIEYQVPLTEPEKGNAIHGFLRWRPWTAVERDDEHVIMAARLFPLDGFPFPLDVRVSYQLGPHGLTVTATAANIGDRSCPYGYGQHPYLSPGRGLIDECGLQLAGRTRVLTDAERQLPMGREPVHGTEYDFLQPHRLGTTRIDYAFTDLVRDPAGRAWTRLWGPDGACVELWVDETCPFVETYTGDTLAPARARRGLGTEPMTGAPNAFGSGDGLIRLEPGESTTTTWGVGLS